MRNKRIFAAILLATAVLLSGCQLAKEDAQAPQPDRLAGVFITEDHLDLFDFEAYFEDNAEKLVKGGENVISAGESAEYSGRVWAEKDGHDYEFPGLEGILLIATVETDEETGEDYHSSTSGEEISDVNHHFITTDFEEAVEMTGTVYVAQSPTGSRSFYLNPVYQASDGRVYVESGTGMTSDCEGGGFSQAMEEKREISENGEKTTERTKVTVNFEFIMPAEKVAFVEMDGENSVIKRTEYAPEDVPAEFETGAEYIIVEFIDRDGNVTREIAGRDGEYLNSFRELDNGVCVKQGTRIIWE